MPIIHLNSLDNAELKPYVSLTEAQLRNRLDEDNGLFIAESPKVIGVAIKAGYKPLSMLCEERHISGDAAFIIEVFPEINVFTGSRELLAQLTGYKLTRGVLCAMKRYPLPTVAQICDGATRLAVIDGVVDTTNIGAIFRSAAALGIDGILLTPTSCDPLNRRAVRVSMGTVFQVPWTWIRETTTSVSGISRAFASLYEYGFKTVAMALSDDSVPIDDPVLGAEKHLAIVLGTEGDGLSDKVVSSCDYVARIPMAHGVDSLNVAAASAVAFWQLRNPTR